MTICRFSRTTQQLFCIPMLRSNCCYAQIVVGFLKYELLSNWCVRPSLYFDRNWNCIKTQAAAGKIIISIHFHSVAVCTQKRTTRTLWLLFVFCISLGSLEYLRIFFISVFKTCIFLLVGTVCLCRWEKGGNQERSRITTIYRWRTMASIALGSRSIQPSTVVHMVGSPIPWWIVSSIEPIRSTSSFASDSRANWTTFSTIRTGTNSPTVASSTNSSTIRRSILATIWHSIPSSTPSTSAASVRQIEFILRWDGRRWTVWKKSISVLFVSPISKYVAQTLGSVHVAPLLGHTQSVVSTNLHPAPSRLLK